MWHCVVKCYSVKMTYLGTKLLTNGAGPNNNQHIIDMRAPPPIINLTNPCNDQKKFVCLVGKQRMA